MELIMQPTFSTYVQRTYISFSVNKIGISCKKSPPFQMTIRLLS